MHGGARIMLVERESRETTYYMTLTWTPPQPLHPTGDAVLHSWARPSGICQRAE